MSNSTGSVQDDVDNQGPANTNIGKDVVFTQLVIFEFTNYRYPKVTSSRPVYYSILELLGQRSQYIRIKFPLHKPS